MKVSLHMDGTLVVSAETHIEAYALRKWAIENLNFADVRCTTAKLIVFHGAELIAEPDPKGVDASDLPGGPDMTEILLFAAILAPLVIVPLAVIAHRQPLDLLHRLDTEIELLKDVDSPFARFERDMMQQIAVSLNIPRELLEEPVSYSSFRDAMLCSRIHVQPSERS